MSEANHILIIKVTCKYGLVYTTSIGDSKKYPYGAILRVPDSEGWRRIIDNRLVEIIEEIGASPEETLSIKSTRKLIIDEPEEPEPKQPSRRLIID